MKEGITHYVNKTLAKTSSFLTHEELNKMSYKSRHRKAFLRYVELLKELPIYSIDQYILIDESACYYKKKKMLVDFKRIKQAEYDKYLESNSIKSSLDFDNYFNPDLTLDLPFEKNKEKANSIIQDTLSEIGQRWKARLKESFPEQAYTIVKYFNDEDSEWFLDFYNGTVRIEDFDGSERYTQVEYLHPD